MDQLEHKEPDKSGDGTPVCLRCFKPVDPLAHYCPHCGEATGQFTHYIPFVNIPWQTRVWGQVWRQIWSRDISLAGRAFRLFMVVWNVPIMLIGLLFKPQQEQKQEQHQNDAGAEQKENSSPD
jgi:hypothetical protein